MPTASLDFAQLFREHYPKIYRYVRYRIDNDLVAEDLTSEIFERAFRYRNTYRPERSAFATWIGQIAQNWVNNYLNSQLHRVSQKMAGQDELESVTALDPTPEAHVIGQEALRLLRDCMDQLNQRDKEVVTLRFSMDIHNKQIAEMLNLKEHTVSVILLRALQSLRGCQEAE